METPPHTKNKILPHEGLSFDDVLLLPSYTDFKRKDVDLTTRIHKKIVLKLPVISSPMDTVTEKQMAIVMAQHGCLGIIHRNLPIEKQAAIIQEIKRTKVTDKKSAALDIKGRLLVGAAVGVGDDFESRVKKVIEAGSDIVVLDSGHGHSAFIMRAVESIKKHYAHVVVMAGNVATYEGARDLIRSGVDVLRVGMGPGSICTTRIVTGVGVPQLTAISQAVQAATKTASNAVTVVADGGVRQIGDMAKALAFGASAVMLGSLLSRFDESPGEVISINGKRYKRYRGMGSIAAMKKGAAERYGQSTRATSRMLIAEGIEGMVPYKGKVSDYLYQIEGKI